MDQRKRTILVTAIAVTIIAGVISGFGLPLFFQGPSIHLPQNADSSQDGGQTVPEEGANFALVRITPETVRSVVESMQRKTQYYRELRVEYYWGAEGARHSALSTSLIWNDGPYSKTTLVDTDGSSRSCLVADGTAYLWYGGDRTAFSYPAGQAEADFLQRIPNYEDILNLPTENILRASYEEKLGKSCIFVEARQKELGYLERFWVSLDSGLLVASETLREEDNMLLYSMSESLYSPLRAETQTFALPDGKVLHSVVLAAQTEE